MRSCPLCGDNRLTDYPYKSYKTCVTCQHTYQPEPPTKHYLNPETGFNGSEGAVMDDNEKSANSWLANWLYSRFKPNTMLDIGCAYPYLSNCFKKMGVETLALDGIYKKEEYKTDLDVPVLGVNWEDLNDGGYDSWQGTDLITMVHVLEHFIDPIACLKRAYQNLSDDGVLFVRSPNRDVAGIERDHTEGHTLIHPNIFNNESMLYAAKKAGFHVLWLDHMVGYGQSSWVFKKKAPTLSLFMIVKNEEENIIECLESIKGLADEVVVLDTGSTDKTIELAESAGAKVFKSKLFNDQIQVGDFHFANARNEAIKYATGDWLFWMDADDRFYYNQPQLSPEKDAYYVEIKYGQTQYKQVRFFRNNWGAHFKGAVHEYPVVDTCRLHVLEESRCYSLHLSGDKPGRIERNIAILEKELVKDPTDKRTLFYLGNAYREGKKYDAAISVYQRYISTGGNFHDELVIARYYLALCYYCKGQWDNALKEAHYTMALDHRWGEAYSLAGECYYYKGQFRKAINYFRVALDMPFPETTMFVEKDRYRGAPRLWTSYCYEKLGDLQSAKEWAKGNVQREKDLAQRVYVIEVCRPGALGDVLCATPVLHELRKKYPEAHIRFVTHKSSIPILLYNPDLDEVVEETGKYADLRINLSYPMNEGFPNVPMTRHLTQCFAENAGVVLSEGWKPTLHLLPDDTVKLEHKKPVITFAVKTGWSQYKEWPLNRWEELIKLFPEYQFIQLGAADEPLIPGAQHMCGKLSLRESFSVLQQSELFVGLDSIFNHVSCALGIPAVIMFGSTSPMGHGYGIHTNLWSEYSCSPCYRENNRISVHPKSPCPYEHKCMVDFMSVERVAEAIRQKLKIQHGQSRQAPSLLATS